MDSLQTANRNAISQYLFLADQARTPEMVVKVIRDALADKGVFSFAELYSKAQVQKLKETDVKTWLHVLEIFMWGTYEDYEQLSGKPELTEAQRLKLRQLTLVTLASRPNTSSVTKKEDLQLYIPNLRKKLYLESNHEVGPLFISTKEQNLLDGSVDDASNILEIKAIFPSRDLHPDEIGEMSSVLSLWISQAEAELKRINTNMDDIKMAANQRRETEAFDAERFEAAIAESSKNTRKRGGPTGNDTSDSGVGSSRNTRQR